MAVINKGRGGSGQAIEIYNDGVVNITSVDVAAQDEIIPNQKIGTRVKGRCTIQITESNGVAVKVQPWASLDGIKWREIDYDDAQKHFDLALNDTEIVYVDDAFGMLYFKLTGYVAAGTAKVIARVLFE